MVPVGMVKTMFPEEPFAIVAVPLVSVADAPLTYTFVVMVIALLPESMTRAVILSGLPGVNWTFVIEACSALPMSPMVIPPIHAATTTLTATVTAISMIDATTGLRAFAFFLNFLM